MRRRKGEEILRLLINLREIISRGYAGPARRQLPVEAPSRTVEKLGNLFPREVSVGEETRCCGRREGRRWNRWPILRAPHSCFCLAIKSFGAVFLSLPHPFPKVQIANMTRGQISARETGVEQLFTSGPLPASAGAPADESLTWTRAR